MKFLNAVYFGKFDTLVFESGANRFGINLGLVIAGMEDGFDTIEAQILKAYKFNDGLTNKKLTADDARTLFDAAVSVLTNNPAIMDILTETKDCYDENLLNAAHVKMVELLNA